MEPPSSAQPVIVLASRSPRRIDLLTKFLDEVFGEGVMSFAIEPADIDETPLAHETPLSHVQRLAQSKAQVIAQRLSGSDVVVIAADTTVDVDGQIYGKPANIDEARVMLNEMSGRSHKVHTAVSVVRGDKQAHTVDSATVTMVSISPEQMDWYLATGESLDKAGAYALQGDGGRLVESVQGGFHTVVGLPLEALGELLVQCGLSWKNGL
ncbi:MAG: Maf family protein [Ilumatobacteraceae bacterium]